MVPERATSADVAGEPIEPQALRRVFHPGPTLHADPERQAGCLARRGAEAGAARHQRLHLTSGLRVQEPKQTLKDPELAYQAFFNPARCQAPDAERASTSPHLPSAFPTTFASGTGCRVCPRSGRCDEPWQTRRGFRTPTQTGRATIALPRTCTGNATVWNEIPDGSGSANAQPTQRESHGQLLGIRRFRRILSLAAQPLCL